MIPAAASAFGSVEWELIPALAWVTGAALGDLTPLNLMVFYDDDLFLVFKIMMYVRDVYAGTYFS